MDGFIDQGELLMEELPFGAEITESLSSTSRPILNLIHGNSIHFEQKYIINGGGPQGGFSDPTTTVLVAGLLIILLILVIVIIIIAYRYGKAVEKNKKLKYRESMQDPNLFGRSNSEGVSYLNGDGIVRRRQVYGVGEDSMVRQGSDTSTPKLLGEGSVPMTPVPLGPRAQSVESTPEKTIECLVPVGKTYVPTTVSDISKITNLPYILEAVSYTHLTLPTIYSV
eukprot:TRINITY_DN6631_c0_g1_i2.p1 TRINITY_DN6631_c0_g1~~TRINITY_DN6631_c0_g1_i2.p1  ORF type:complete len:225 (+),score=14.71 TRINITY_DN6631_c0_g1_i2:86-760(+)